MRSTRRIVTSLRARLLGRRFGTIVAVQTDRPLAALTFDDGPDPTTTPRVLEVLARHRAHATFFMVGRKARREPDLVTRVVAAGHAVGHHTLDHVSLTGLDRATVRTQIDQGFAAVGPACDRLFRPPYGHQDLAVWRAAREAGHEVVAWTSHVEDWTPQPAAEIERRLGAALAPGAIILLHDAPQLEDNPNRPREALLTALDALLTRATREGWRFVTLPELFDQGRVTRRVRWRLGGADQAGAAGSPQMRHGA
jgi:peptidoglycan/xylan/chitin deacetylase (PgdA/CDA1 family)